MRLRSLWAVLAVAVILVAPYRANAQGATGTVSASYTVLRDTDAVRTFDRGISVAGTRRVRGWASAAADVSISTAHEDFSASQGGTYDFRYLSLQAGPRLSPRSGRVQPYTEVLAGITRLGIWERHLDQTGAWGSPEFSLQPGLGADVLVTPRVAVRLGGDVRLLFRRDNRFDTSYQSKLFRFSVGVALHFGDS